MKDLKNWLEFIIIFFLFSRSSYDESAEQDVEIQQQKLLPGVK